MTVSPDDDSITDFSPEWKVNRNAASVSLVGFVTSYRQMGNWRSFRKTSSENETAQGPKKRCLRKAGRVNLPGLLLQHTPVTLRNRPQQPY